MTTELNQEIKPLTAEDIDGIRKRWTVRGRYYLAQCEGCGYTGSSEGFHSDGEDIRCPCCHQDRVAEVSQDAYPVVALLATVDALTQRAGRAEAAGEVFRRLLAEETALADARGRALEDILGRDGVLRSERTIVEIAEAALALPAPEALRQQQEREAEKDALIEALRGALDKCSKHFTFLSKLAWSTRLKDADKRPKWKVVSDEALAGVDYLNPILNLTPPQALHRLEDLRQIAAAALKVATWKWTCSHPPAVQSGGVCRQCQDLRDLESALLPLLGAEPKGGQA